MLRVSQFCSAFPRTEVRAAGLCQGPAQQPETSAGVGALGAWDDVKLLVHLPNAPNLESQPRGSPGAPLLPKRCSQNQWGAMCQVTCGPFCSISEAAPGQRGHRTALVPPPESPKWDWWGWGGTPALPDRWHACTAHLPRMASGPALPIQSAAQPPNAVEPEPWNRACSPVPTGWPFGARLPVIQGGIPA